MGTLDRGQAPIHPASISWLIALDELRPHANHLPEPVPVHIEEPGHLRYGRDPTLRNILCVVRMRACTSGVAMLTSGLLRDCGSGAFSKPHGAQTNSATGTTAAQEPSSTVHVTVLPHTACPHVRWLLHGVWWRFTGCGGRSLTARVPCPHGITVTYGSPSQTAESPHCLSDPILPLSQRPSLACASFGKTFWHPAKYAAPSPSKPCNGCPRTGRAW